MEGGIKARLYEFGRFQLDPDGRHLTADGEPVPLGPTDFRLLVALVERAGALVSKDNLMSLVGGRSDNVLHVHISALRRSLGNDCIINQQGRGYRLATSVRQTGPTSATASASERFATRAKRSPTASTRLIGRNEELQVILALLAKRRLVTLTGPGGVGKTRLAFQAAHDVVYFADGIWIVELAGLGKEDLVAGAVATALGVHVGSNATPLDTLARYLAHKSSLIVLDNCEHVLGAAALVAETLLTAASGLKILATSRQALACSGEQVMEVSPLALPRPGATSPEAIRNMAAIELFIERAMAADANFRIDDSGLPVAARICHRVDGLPLAIEMVAGWAGVLGLEKLNAKLDQSLDKCLRAGNSAPARHAAMRATLAWSHGLLSADERAVLYWLSVFAGAFSLEAAEAVAADEVRIPKEEMFEYVAQLVRKSMIGIVPGAQRYRLLQTTRAFMLEELAASGKEHAARQRHAWHILHMLEQAKYEWEVTGDAVWVERYSPLLDDLRAALDWAMGQDSNDAVALAGVSWPLFQDLSLRPEGAQRLHAAAARLRSDTPLALEAEVRLGLGRMWVNTAAMQSGHQELERAVFHYRALGDRSRLGRALQPLAFSLLALGRTEEADRANQEAVNLLEDAGWLRSLASALADRSCIEIIRGRFDAARIAADKALRVCEITGAHKIALVVAANLVQLSFDEGDVEGAISAGRVAADRLRHTCYSNLLGFVLGLLSAAITVRGNLDEALTLACEAAPLLREDGTLFWLFDHLALRSALGGRAGDAAVIVGYADAVHQKFGLIREPMGRRARERTASLLCDLMTGEEVTELGGLGAKLSEDQAIKLALSA